MSCINQYIHSESDCETIYSFEEEEEEEREEEEEEEEYDFEYYDDIDEYYYNESKELPSVKVPTVQVPSKYLKIPEKNPWKKNSEEVVKTMAEIFKEEEEIRKIEEKKKEELEKISKQRKERFRNSRSSFHFKNDSEAVKKKFLLKK